MSGSMLVHDTRVQGIAPTYANNTYPVNEWTSITHAFGWIATHAQRQGGLDDLDIICHGYENQRGAWAGLALCDTTVDENNVSSIVSQLKPNGRALVRTIRLFACSGAGNTRGRLLLDTNSQIDRGMIFCQRFADYSGAILVASRERQAYRLTTTMNIDLGQWEGQVIHFHPHSAPYYRR
jgi:hypothetical protein